MKVVVGLGNPGSRYERTRHNLGFMVVGGLEKDLLASPVPSKALASVSRGSVRSGDHEEPVLLVQPATYMNLSGSALAALSEEGKMAALSPADLLVVLDDVYLPFGALRLRGSGSAGGHNGLTSVLESVGTVEVPRLRCGVGPAPESQDMADFVLEDFTPEESRLLPEFLLRARSAVRTFLEEGLAAAMNRFNQIQGATG